MRKTANYELNQWDPGDRILREEFNGDNERIDAALTGMPYVKLVDVTATATAQQVDVDVSSIDFSRYWKVEFFVDPKRSTVVNLRVNGLSSGYQYTAAHAVNTSDCSDLGYLGPGTLVEVFPIFADQKVTLKRSSFGASATLYSAPKTWSELVTLNFLANFAVGGRIVILGVKRDDN